MAEVKNYKRKPTVVQAIQFTGNNFDELKEFCDIYVEKDSIFNSYIDGEDKIGFHYLTKEGTVRVIAGDYLVKGVDGVSYPCNQKIFPFIYEETELPYKIANVQFEEPVSDITKRKKS